MFPKRMDFAKLFLFEGKFLTMNTYNGVEVGGILQKRNSTMLQRSHPLCLEYQVLELGQEAVMKFWGKPRPMVCEQYLTGRSVTP